MTWQLRVTLDSICNSCDVLFFVRQTSPEQHFRCLDLSELAANHDLKFRPDQLPLLVHREGCVVWDVVVALHHQLAVGLNDIQ